jgi:two-component system, LytTR family, sensor kinase
MLPGGVRQGGILLPEGAVSEPVRKGAGLRLAALVFGGATVVALLSFWYRYSDVLARDRTEPFQVKLIEELTGVYGAVLLLIPVVWLTARLHRRGLAPLRRLPLHLLGAAAFSVAHTTLMWASRSAIFPLAGLGAYDYGRMPMRYAMELGTQIPVYVLAVLATLAWEQRRRAREQTLKLAQLEGELARARLANLEHQLRPHFLFNALNTVSSVMYEDQGRADRLLADLSRFLRRSLRGPEAQEVTLGEELESLELFLAVARARFEERLEVRICIDEGLERAAVPGLLLQPLVENALRHGDPGEGRPLRIRVAAHREGGTLVLRVEDDGPGSEEPLEVLLERGIGLENTQRRLQLLHPGRHRFAGGGRPGGGFLVHIHIPFHELGSRAAHVGH